MRALRKVQVLLGLNPVIENKKNQLTYWGAGVQLFWQIEREGGSSIGIYNLADRRRRLEEGIIYRMIGHALAGVLFGRCEQEACEIRRRLGYSMEKISTLGLKGSNQLTRTIKWHTHAVYALEWRISERCVRQNHMHSLKRESRIGFLGAFSLRVSWTCPLLY